MSEIQAVLNPRKRDIEIKRIKETFEVLEKLRSIKSDIDVMDFKRDDPT